MAQTAFRPIREAQGLPPNRDALHTLPDEFWEEFVGTHWDKSPVLIKAPFRTPLASEEEVFDIAVHASQDYKSFRRRTTNVFVDYGRRICDINQLLPDLQDQSFDSYRRRLGELIPAQEGTFVFYECQLYDANLWMRVRRFLHGLYRLTGLPASTVDMDVFMGRYHRTPTGIHKDDASNFSYVVSGVKRMLFWPGDTFKDVVPMSATSVGTVHYESFPQRPLSIEANAGDLIYWPASFWHMAASDDGSSPVTLNIALYRRKEFSQVFRHLMETREFSAWLANHFVAPTALPFVASPARSEIFVPKEIAQETNAFRGLGNHPGLAETIEDLWFRKASASGFEMVPPPLPLPSLEDSEVVHGEPEFPIISIPRGDGKAKLFANGHVISAPWSHSVSTMITRLNSGTEYRVEQLLGSSLGAVPESDIREARNLRHLLKLLCSFRAVARRKQPTEIAALGSLRS